MNRAFLYFLITAIFWGANFHFAKHMLQSVNFIEAGFWRYLFGIIPLVVVVIGNIPKLTEIKENIKGILLVGVIGIFGFNLFFFLGLVNSPAINGALIISLTPATTILFSSLILKTPLQKNQIIGTLISLFGVLFLLLKGNIWDFVNFAFSWSDVLFLIAVALFGLQNVWIKIHNTNLANKDFTLLTNVVCLICFALVLPFIGISSFTSHAPSFWQAALGIGFFGTAIAYLLWNKGIQLTSANKAGIFINVVPLSAACISLALGESIQDYHLISGLFIIAGVLVTIGIKFRN